MRSVGLALAILALLAQIALPAFPHAMAAGRSDQESLARFWSAAGLNWKLCAIDPAGPAEDGDRSPHKTPAGHGAIDCPICVALSHMASGLPVATPALSGPSVAFVSFVVMPAEVFSAARRRSSAQPRAPPAII
jgi:hypothetical protein